MLSMVFMIVYILVSIPASWLIDTYGFRTAVCIGALLTGVFGLLRGVFAYSYILVLISQIGIAIGQPLIVNSVTKVVARWFTLKERATATGLSWLAGYLGLIIGLTLTPYLTEAMTISNMLVFYGIISAVCAVAFITFSREKPAEFEYVGEPEENVSIFESLKRLMKNKDFILFNTVFFICLGIFNGLSTWIENIVKPRGFSSAQAGVMGGLMVACGVLGSAIIPLLSDRFRNRTRFILIAIAGCVPGLVGIAYARSYWLILASACVLGFFMLSTAPVGFQYCAEICHPVPEGTSTGVLMMMGQIAGMVFIFGMDMLKSRVNGSMTLPILGLIVLLLVCIPISARLKESKFMSDAQVDVPMDDVPMDDVPMDDVPMDDVPMDDVSMDDGLQQKYI